MALIPDKAAFQNSLADLPLVTYQPGETVIVDGSTSGRLLILKKGNVAVVKEGTEIATVAEPGAFGELSVLLDQPHTADVRALETSQFHVADATAFLTQNPIALLYVATVLAHRLDGANQALVQLKRDFLPSAAPHLFSRISIRSVRVILCDEARRIAANITKLPRLLRK
jgi:CRP-like cAMP-binding protein